MSAMLTANRRRLLFIVVVSAVLSGVSLLAALLHIVTDQAAADGLAPRLIQLGLCTVAAVVVVRVRSARLLEILAVVLALIFAVMRCVMITRMPADAPAAMMVGGLAFLYFGLPLRLSVLAPLMAAISGAMLAAWLTREPSPSAMLSVVEWVWVVNLLGLVCVRTMRLTLRRQWAQAQSLRQMATHDGLTGLANRTFYDHALSREWANGQRAGAPLSLILVNVDHFKLLNRAIGHAAGDACLRDLASVLENCALRPADIVARTGGAEFALLLPNTSAHAAHVAARRVAEAVEHAAMAHPASPIGPFVTVSLGVATAQPGDGFAPWEMTALADRLIVQAKQHGGNVARQQSLDDANASPASIAHRRPEHGLPADMHVEF